jgi:glutathione S-transferase
MQLYYFPGSCALADHIVLEWTGAKYEAIKLDRAATKSPEFLELNPSGAVPVLVDGDFVLTQNVAILSYLAELYPDARLYGDGTPRGRAEVMRWLGILNSDMHPAFKPIFGAARFHPDPYLFVMLRWVKRVSIDASGLDNVARFFDRMQADRGVRAALTSQEGAPQ